MKIAAFVAISCIVLFTECAGSTLTVSPMYFSGRRNPKWQIQQSPDTSRIFELYQKAKTDRSLLSPGSMPSRLGYRGFVISDDGMKTSELAIGGKTQDLQLLLVENGQKQKKLSAKIVKNIQDALKSGKVMPAGTAARRAPPTWPADNVWLDMRVRDCNNCYNYAVDKILPRYKRFGVPGLGEGQPWWQVNPTMTAAGIRDAAVRDGLIVTAAGPGGAIPQIPAQHALSRHLVALVVDPDSFPGANDGDFHWYRLDNNNRWSHKPGSTAVTNLDNNGALINDPRNSANGLYQFVCFMTVPKNVVKVQGTDEPKC